MGLEQRWGHVPGTAWEAAEAAAGEAMALTFELLAPAHDATTRLGASVRVVPAECWMPARHAFAHLLDRSGARPAALLVGRADGVDAASDRAAAAAAYFHRRQPAEGMGSCVAWARQRKPLPWRHMLERTRIDSLMGAALEWGDARRAAVATRCNGKLAREGSRPAARPLHWLVQPDASSWPVNCEPDSRELCAAVRRVAVNRTVMVAVANQRIAHDQYLGKYVDLVRDAGVRNLLICALDNKTAGFLEARGVSWYLRRLRTRTGADSSSTDNHATSALKFEVLHELLIIGVSVLLTDGEERLG